jgi:hypothetical protein
MRCEECDAPLWRAGDDAPPGVYVRIDIPLEHRVILLSGERLPASFDGHIAIYRAAGCTCAHLCRLECTKESGEATVSGAAPPDQHSQPHEENRPHDDLDPTLTRRAS